MYEEYHIYTIDEISHSDRSPLMQNWKPTDYLLNVDIYDPNVGVRQVHLLAFKNKLSAFNYFRDYVAVLRNDYTNKDYFLKLSDIDNSINLIRANKSDENVDLSVVEFQFEDLTLSIYSSGYWIDAAKLILQQIINELDSHFEILNEDDSNEDEESDIKNLKFSISSLESIQEQCRNLICHEDTCSPIFVNKFNELCKYMNDFWDFWWE